MPETHLHHGSTASKPSIFCRQPLMAASERLIRRTLPRVAVLHYEVWYEVPVFEHIVFSPLMLINRTVIVVVAVVIVSLLLVWSLSAMLEMELQCCAQWQRGPSSCWELMQIFLLSSYIVNSRDQIIPTLMKARCNKKVLVPTNTDD